MAKSIVVDRGGVVSSFDFSKLSRSKLYGTRRRVALDPSGRPCAKAALTGDGSLLLRAGMTAQGYFDEADNWVPNSALVGLDPHGKPLEILPSTLGAAQELRGPVPPQDLLDLRVSAVYALEPADVDAALREELDSGAIFRFDFRYRPDDRSHCGFRDRYEEFQALGVEVVAVHFGPPSLASAWSDDQGFQYEVWTDDSRTLALNYGAAASAGAFAPDRVTALLDANGNWLLEYTTGTGNVSHTADVLADCQALFGGR